ncbi:MAG: hypothetical protein ACRCZI_02860 [Cetobacterium sp.]
MNKDSLEPLEYMDFVKLRMRRTEKLTRLLELNDRLLKIDMLVNYRKLQHNNNYRNIVKEISDLEREQIFNYSTANEIHINNLATLIQKVKPDLDDLVTECSTIIPEMAKLSTNIAIINQKLPSVIYDNKPPIPEHKKRCTNNAIGLLD